MDRFLVLAGLLTTGCVDADPPMFPDPGDPWDLVKTRTMAGELPIAGIDSDRAGGLWIAYALAPSHATPTDNMRLVHLDATGAKRVEHRWTDPEPRLSGIAFSGDALWLNIAPGFEGGHVRKLDPATGTELTRIAVEPGITDLDVDATRGELLLSSYFDRIVALDLASGAETWRAQLRPEVTGYVGLQSAIAATGTGEVWVASRYTDRLEVVDANHQVIASYTTEVTGNHHTTDFSLFLAWDGQLGQVIAAAENQISWLKPREGTP